MLDDRQIHRSTRGTWLLLALLVALLLGSAGCQPVLGSDDAGWNAGKSAADGGVPERGVVIDAGGEGHVVPPDGGCPPGPLDPALGKIITPEALLGPTVQASVPPPPISGGTLLLSADKKTLLASDPDRDLVYLIDLPTQTLRATVQLQAGDEPGRLAEDGAAVAHVALRGGKSIANIDIAGGKLLSRTPVCDLPRGIAYEAATDSLHVACAEGKLVTLPAALGAATRTVELGRDLRDVIVQGGKLFVTRLRSAQLLRLDAQGAVEHTFLPPKATSMQTQIAPGNVCGMGTATDVMVEHTPTVAWRALAVPGHGIAMLHQRSRTTEVSTTPGGYGSSGCGSTIVQTALTLAADTDNAALYPALDSMTLPVDLAADSIGKQLAVVAPGNWGAGAGQVALFLSTELQVAAGLSTGAADADGGVAISPPMMGGCMSPSQIYDPPGQATAASFVQDTLLAVQTREPATLTFYDLTVGVQPVTVMLSPISRADSGHTMFHARAGAGIACASCHAEAGDDGHVWSFAGIGARRTQHLRGGILGSEPFHWNGDMNDFGTLMKAVFVGRMSGFAPSPDQESALSHWVDRQPALRATPSDTAAVARGRTLFESAAVGCASCHAGAQLTNNATVDVGTGHALQVPSLHGVSFRAPFLHDGCAATLLDRFGSCGGGDKHGHTSKLSKAQLGDLVSYLETL